MNIISQIKTLFKHQKLKFEIEGSLFIMPKLKIEYRTKEQDRENYFKDNTYFTFKLKDKTTIISIAPNETEKLSDIVHEIEKELQDGHHFEKNEMFEISEFDKQIMETEENMKYRVDSQTYNLCKMGYEAVMQGKTTFDNLMKIMKREVDINDSNN